MMRLTFDARRRFLWLMVATLSGVVATLSVLAQEDGANSGNPEVSVLRSALQASSLEDNDRAVVDELLDEASAAFQESKRLQAQLSTLRLEAETVGTELASLESSLAAAPSENMDVWRARLSEETETQTLEDLLLNQREALAALDEEIDRISQELVDILSGPASAAEEIGVLEQRILRLESEVPEAAADQELAAQARELRRRAELESARAGLELRRFEQDWAGTRQELYELTLRELTRRREQYEERVDILQTRVATRGRTQLSALVEVLERRAEELADAPEIIASAALTNAELGRDIARHTESLAEDRAALAQSAETQEQVARTLRDARVRLEVGGTSQVVGRWLWSERQRLESPASIEARLETLRDDLATVRLDEVVLGEQRDMLEASRATAQGRAARAAEDAAGAQSAAETSATLAPLVRQQFELISLKEPLLRQRIEAVEERERLLMLKAEDSLELQRLFDRYLLSAPSHEPINLDWLNRVPEGISATLSLPDLRIATERMRQPTLRTLLFLLPGVVVLLILFQLRRRASRHIEALAITAREYDSDSFRATLSTLLWTLLAALPLPLICLMVGAYLQDIGIPGAIGQSLGQATSALALPLYAVLVLYWTSREEGLGHRHFGWSAPRRSALRRILPVAFGVILPMAFITWLSLARDLEASSDILARAAIVLASLVSAGALWYCLGPNRLWELGGGKTEPAPLRKLLRVLLTLLIASIAWFALQGFVYSASQLLNDVLRTFAALVLISLLIGLIGRWLLLGEQRLAASREGETGPQPLVSDDVDGEMPAKPELSLEDVNAQTGRLLGALRIVLVIGAVFWVWAEAFPAFTRLEEIVLWRVAVVGVDGQPESQAISLLALLSGVFTVMVTVAAARNLPGLIEIVLANYTKVDAPSRYAVTSVLRYAIVITGTLLALSLVGMQWSRLQWLAAALTVGLGFGLQEIFANFVSGLILLFERAFRVGDIITVGELSGRVTRIRTRATTILDFDNREIVIPNKEFITGQLVNWTLTDSTTRQRIVVGVAYGTSPPLVHKLLKQAAREHPLVLDDPEPLSWFMEFGASSLDFNLLVFVASPRDIFPVRDALNTRIAELFAEHDIEIAFPQMDIHVRSADGLRDAPAAPAS